MRFFTSPQKKKKQHQGEHALDSCRAQTLPARLLPIPQTPSGDGCPKSPTGTPFPSHGPARQEQPSLPPPFPPPPTQTPPPHLVASTDEPRCGGEASFPPDETRTLPAAEPAPSCRIPAPANRPHGGCSPPPPTPSRGQTPGGLAGTAASQGSPFVGCCRGGGVGGEGWSPTGQPPRVGTEGGRGSERFPSPSHRVPKEEPWDGGVPPLPTDTRGRPHPHGHAWPPHSPRGVPGLRPPRMAGGAGWG